MVTLILRLLPQFNEDGEARIPAAGEYIFFITRAAGQYRRVIQPAGEYLRFQYVIAGVAGDAGIEGERLDLLQTDLDHLLFSGIADTVKPAVEQV